MEAEKTISALFEFLSLGKVLPPVTPVSGGYMHRMYRVNTAGCSYAVKHLNPEIMKRAAVMDNYRRAEKLEQVIEDAGIPIVPALTVNGRKMQELNGEYFYIFHWQDGRITDWYNITPEQCRQAGSILGRIHALQPRCKADTPPVMSAIDWAGYISKAAKQESVIVPLLKESEQLLNDAQDMLNRARLALPAIECITNEDMDPKNVMWNNGRPVVIDLECLDYGNPVSHVLQLSLQWAGITTCSLDPVKVKAFFDGYLEAWDNGFRDYGSVLGLAYTWIEWLEYNITRALWQCRDESEQETGISEVRNTLSRIRYIHGKENDLRQLLNRILPAGNVRGSFQI